MQDCNLIRCDDAGTTDAPPVMRLDRAELRKPRRLDDGSWRYEATLSRVDAVLRYSWGEEVADESALSSPEYLDSLRGLAVVARHPDAKRVDIDKPDTYVEVGVVTGARWDAAERQVVAELTVRNVEANNAIQAGQDGVSEGYTVPHLDATTSPARQLRRIPNHVALTMELEPRMPGARIRADESDQENTMEMPALLALCSAFGLRTDSTEHLREDLDALRALKANADAEKTRADAAEAKLEALAPTLKALGVDDTRTDSIDVDAIITARVSEVVDLTRRADSLDVTIPDDAKTATAIRTTMARELLKRAGRTDADDLERCDVDPGYCMGVIASAVKPDASETFARSVRVDADDLPSLNF